MKRKNRKPNANSKVMKLKPEQRDQLDIWLVDENLSYAQIVKKCLEQFGVSLSRFSLHSYYELAAQNRTLDRLSRSVTYARKVKARFKQHRDEMVGTILNIVGQLAFEASMAAEKDKKRKLDSLREHLELYISVREEHRLGEKFSLEREKWEFDVVRACHDHYAQLQTIMNNQSLDEPSRLQAIRQRLFGDNLAEDDRDPNKKPPPSPFD